MTIFTGDFATSIDMIAPRPDASPAVVPAATAPAADRFNDAQLYLRHVENGESIRSLAREAGCHASTILRRIRRFEARRDDPLIDAALTPRPTARPAIGPGNDRLAMRVLRRLAEPGAVLATASGMDKAIVTRDDIRTAVLERPLAEAMALEGWVVQTGQTGRLQRYVITAGGRAALRRMLRSPRQRNAVPGPADFADASPVARAEGTPEAGRPDMGMAEGPADFHHADQHRIWESRVIEDPEDGRRRRRRVNVAESPLLVLARRREANGQAFLTPGMVTAGERLREDFELAQMGPRVTQNWDGFMTAGINVSRSAGGYRRAIGWRRRCAIWGPAWGISCCGSAVFWKGSR